MGHEARQVWGKGTQMNEEQLIFVESAANTLRGMTMDPRIPADARGVLIGLATELDALSDYFLAEDDGEPDPDRLREDRDDQVRLAREDET
jgi:hypothetical protein